jgi:hypothetical protein
MGSPFISPRLNDYFNLKFTQDDVDFAIPYLDRDIPLFIDPFLFWNSKNGLLNQLHDNLMNFFEYVRILVCNDREMDAKKVLSGIMEPNELGLGYSVGSKRGSTIGTKLVENIISMYRDIPQINEQGLDHIEEIQFVVPKISVDRISDITYCVLKDFFVKYTMARAEEHGIPVKNFMIANVWDPDNMVWIPGVKASLPYSPLDESPLILAPLNLLRHFQWINSSDYKKDFFYRHVLPRDKMRQRKMRELSSTQIIQANRLKFDRVKAYVHIKEKTADLCAPDAFNDEVILEDKLREANRSLRHLEKQAIRYGEALVPQHIALGVEDQRDMVKK